MRQGGGRLGVEQELAAALGISRDLTPHDLDRRRPAKPRVARPEHVADAAAADAVENPVVSERLDHRGRDYTGRAAGTVV